MLYQIFERLARRTTQWAGSTLAFVLATGVVVGWLAVGPVFYFSDTWQLVVNTGTTIITFLMVFLLQRAHNKDIITIQLKLDELIASTNGASNKLIHIEDLSETEIESLQDRFRRLKEMSAQQNDSLAQLTIEDVTCPNATTSLLNEALSQ